MPSPYGPDRSLPIAAAVLIGGCLLIIAAVYLLTISARTLTDWHQTRFAEAHSQTRARSTARHSPQRAAPTVRRGGTPSKARAPSLLFGQAPAWNSSETPSPLSRSPARGMYDLDVDLRHADLGPPSEGTGLGGAGAGTDRVEGENPTGGAPNPGGAPLSLNHGIEPSGAGTTWKSEASELGRRARALSGALAHLDRANRSSNEARRSGSNPASGDASTASTGGPHGPGDTPDPPPDPDQVPVDGGLGGLAAAGAAYAANRLRKHRDAGESDDEA